MIPSGRIGTPAPRTVEFLRANRFDCESKGGHETTGLLCIKTYDFEVPVFFVLKDRGDHFAFNHFTLGRLEILLGSQVHQKFGFGLFHISVDGLGQAVSQKA